MIKKIIEKPKIKEKYISIFKEVKKHQDVIHNQLKQTSFKIVNKQVPKKAIDKLVENYNSGKLHSAFKFNINSDKIHKRFNMYVFPLTKSVLATIRIKTASSLEKYLTKANRFYNLLSEAKPKRFDVAPIDIIDIREVKNDGYAVYMLIEKVHPTVDVDIAMKILDKLRGKNDFKINEHRYSKNFIRFLKSKNIKDLDEFAYQLDKAVTEYMSIFMKSKSFGDLIDVNTGNILILDYNPKTKKFLFGGIDFAGVFTNSVN